ncbi:MAG: universal stress protein [Gemmatimonadetes bacterium]|nr:universal stress protein [Gemmatimonadota bacterium]
MCREASVLTRIFHPTDFSPASDAAFVHALKLALASHSSLTIFHFARGAEAEDHGHEFPQIRETLTQWGLIQPQSPRDAVGALGLRVRKVEVEGDDPTAAVLDYLGDHPADLMVLATYQRSGVARWLYREIASPLVRRSALIALFVPPGADGFVDFHTGRVRLQRILLPIDQHPHPGPAIEMLPAIMRGFHQGTVTVELLHVGTAATMPRFHLPKADGWIWTTRLTQGDPVDEILRAAADGADLLTLTTEGRRGFFDALRGSTTERIVRGARCPVLAVPTVVPVDAGSWAVEPMLPSPARP